MKNYHEELGIIAFKLLMQSDLKPNYSEGDFMNIVVIFQTALMDKVWEVQEFDNMSVEERLVMCKRCGEELRKFIYTYTNIDTKQKQEALDDLVKLNKNLNGDTTRF